MYISRVKKLIKINNLFMIIKIEISLDKHNWTLHKEINSTVISTITRSIINRYKNLTIVKKIELSILLTDNKRMLILNSQFRSIKKSTNVLSFQDLDINWRYILEFRPDVNYMYLGDIAFGYEIVKQEAEKKRICFMDHFKHLLVHAILHLIGYNHIKDEEAEVMEALEVEILDEYNVKSPYLIQ